MPLNVNGKSFSLGAILSVTTGVMCIKGLDGVYEILNYMTTDDLYTHSLPRAAVWDRDALDPWFLRLP